MELENILNYHKHIDIKLGLVVEIGDSLKIANRTSTTCHDGGDVYKRFLIVYGLFQLSSYSRDFMGSISDIIHI